MDLSASPRGSSEWGGYPANLIEQRFAAILYVKVGLYIYK